MKKGIRTVCYDDELQIEAYCFRGIMQPFPNHFHEYYVIGIVEEGTRYLTCKNQEYTISAGDIILFNPGDNHACIQNDRGTLDYRAVNIQKSVMLGLAEEVTGVKRLPGFSENVIHDNEAACYLRILHERIMEDSGEFDKEENLLLLLTRLITKYGQPFEKCMPECDEGVEKAVSFIQEHFAEHISLEQICQAAHLSKSTLLRAFTKAKGISPYSYLENFRIGEAKKMLEQGIPPIDAAMRTGFADQSHFTNFFNKFIGLTPRVYRDIFVSKEKGEEDDRE